MFNFPKPRNTLSGFPTAEKRLSPDSSKHSGHRDSFQHLDYNVNSKPLKSIQNQVYFSSEDSSTLDMKRNTATTLNHKRNSQEDEISRLSVEELNLQLDNNMNEIMFLFNKRKMMVAHKKRKLRDEFNMKFDKNKINHSNSAAFLSNDQQLSNKLGCFLKHPDASSRVLSSLIDVLPNIEHKRAMEQQKSQTFWNANQKYEQEIDIMLARLKQIDHNLEKHTNEVAEICKNLDVLEDNLKDLLVKKSDDHLKKAQPLFVNKKKTYELLNQKNHQRENIKDQKIQYIKKIKDLLVQLKGTREGRLKQIYQIFEVDDYTESDAKIAHYTECAQGIEQLVKLKDMPHSLDSQERDITLELDSLYKTEERLFSELIKKQNDEAKAYQHYQAIINQKLKYNIVLTMFEHEISYIQQNCPNQNDGNEFAALKMYRDCLKGYAEEDRMIKLGLVKTNETYKTFTNILRGTENQKERRKELLNLVEVCSKLKNDEQHKKEQLRNLTIQLAKKSQQRNHIEQQLENMITDGDLDSYKKVGNALNKCEIQTDKLTAGRRSLQAEIDSINRQIVMIASKFKQQYNDILKDILPTNFELNLKTSDDIKQVKNYLRKTYKRLGLIHASNQ